MQYLTLAWITYCRGKENTIKDIIRSNNQIGIWMAK